MSEDYTRPLYQAIAGTLHAMQNCVKVGNDEWHTKHGEKLERFSDLLPSGSGFDSGSKIDLDDSRIDRLVIHTSFHHMNENGMYDGWSEHSVIVTPSLEFGFNLRVTGRDRNDIKDYIAETFQWILMEVWNVTQDKLQSDIAAQALREKTEQDKQMMNLGDCGKRTS